MTARKFFIRSSEYLLMDADAIDRRDVASGRLVQK
jgi:hypothetical protein